MIYNLSDYVDQRHCGFGGGDEVLAPSTRLFAAVQAPVAFVLGMQKTDADACLDAPAGRKDEVVAIRKAATYDISFVTLDAHSLEQTQGELHFAYVILSVHQVHTEEVSSERLAHPVAELGLNEPMFPAFLLSYRERVVVEDGIE